ncbi:MAG TPA: acetyl-CoA carboxylase biotin carboxyl carrier protein [Candidatus Marinimicrobia bacterium]|nr:acetyl-CoA carboxylase biotin carboxyl carrier protein [Candidatus Neomarinimicrobiota bacterium]
MRSKKILELVKILESHDISEIEISQWGRKIRITKNHNKSGHAEDSVVTSEVSRKSIPYQFVEVAGIADKHLAESDKEKIQGVEIKAPIVGTFYQASAPDAEPYVRVGDHITVGQPLCIIEAMKIMNVIESEVSGKLKKIVAENAQPVEYNQTLFIIDPAG